ncbi:ParB N-terminal domain-containing protein [Nitratireductor sp. GZWM139]|uniref:ParB N-terminal domain-containing protein n=1 Tax=Nitratireductor sp. GZWM139 TaxID=2950541 RepID=UPI0024BD76EE|nr:ParB N-terminal domain-containing protein [Nitratireductor sp. GZWM139]MDJ1463434.1 ParB N-terminal domain-containing protein [Nitratireductor sp. GZWM139]
MKRLSSSVERRSPGATESASAASPKAPRPAADAHSSNTGVRSILIKAIDVPTNRLRPVKPWRVETLRKEIGEGCQPQHPIVVAAEKSGRFTLIAGALRLAALDLGGATHIDASVIEASTLTPDRRLLLEITENLNREELTKLERAESLVELKHVHERLYPDTRRGGDRRSAKAKAVIEARRKSADQNEIFAFSSHAADMTGLSRRAIEIAVAIIRGLSGESKSRLRGTWLEDHQAGLKLLSSQTSEYQSQICDLLFATPPKATTVADALALVEGRRLLTPAEKLFASTVGNWARLSARQRADFLDTQEVAIREHAEKRGWFA